MPKTSETSRKWQRPPRSGNTILPYRYDPGPLTFTAGLECFYCGGQVTYAHATFDHIMPRSRIEHLGLADAPNNLVVACSPCNLSKGTRKFDEWLVTLIKRSMGRNVGQWERELAVICRSQAIQAMIQYRNLDHIDPTYEPQDGTNE